MKRISTVIFCTLALAVAAFLAFWFFNESPYKEFVSPDQKYKLEIYTVGYQMGFPGQGGDRQGVMRLVDRRGRVINEMKLEMANLIDEPKWSASTVGQRVVFEWDLPAVGE